MQVHNIVPIVLPPAMAFSYMLYEVFLADKISSRSGSQKRQTTGAIGSASLENSLKDVQVLGDFTRQSHSPMSRFTGAPLSAKKSILDLLM